MAVRLGGVALSDAPGVGPTRPARPRADPGEWAARVGRLWADRWADLGLPVDLTVLEVGPGFLAKVGHGLAGAGFRGTLVLVEPNGPARARSVRQYRRLLPRAEVRASHRPVPDATGLGPGLGLRCGAVDVIVANHVLDDMVLRSHLAPAAADRLFAAMSPGSPCSPSFVRAWRAMLRSGGVPGAVRQVADDVVAYVCAVAPAHVVLNDYRSWQQGRSGLDVVHEVGAATLRRVDRGLRAVGMTSTCRRDDAMPGLTWLVASASASTSTDRRRCPG